MSKFKITSGEFLIVVTETTMRKAGDLAIRLHNQSNNPTKLGQLTLVEKLDKRSKPTGDHAFIATHHLLNDNTDGLGEETGQYSLIKERNSNDQDQQCD